MYLLENSRIQFFPYLQFWNEFWNFLKTKFFRVYAKLLNNSYSNPGKFCNWLLTEILTEVPISHSLTEFNQHFNR